MPFGRVCAVIVAYRPGPELRENIAALLPQVEYAILIDNGSDGESLAMLGEIASAHPEKLEFHSHTNNLAAAQNRGIEIAQEKGYDWVLLLDDDSRADESMIAHMRQFYERHPAPDTIGLLAPSVQDVNTGLAAAYTLSKGRFGFRRARLESDHLKNPFYVIASGSLIRIAVLNETDIMDESFGIDYVDCDFCLRLRKHGYDIYVLRDGLLHHRPGRKQARQWLFWRAFPSHYGPERRYTITRNRLRSWARHLRRAPGFVLFDALAFITDLLKILAFEDQKPAKLCAILHGAADALFGTQSYPSFFESKS